MRIQEKSSRPFMIKVASIFSKRLFGKVIAPLRTIYSVQPALLGMVTKISRTEKKLTLAPELRRLITTFVSTLNNCSFCADLNLFMANKMNIEKQKLKVLLNFRNEKSFNEKEKAMLAYCEEVTLTKTSTDACFTQLKKYFSEKEIVEITWLNAVENYFNLMAKPLKISSDALSNNL